MEQKSKQTLTDILLYGKKLRIILNKSFKQKQKIPIKIYNIFNITIEVSDSKIEVKYEIFINEKLLEIKENQGVNFVFL